MPACGESVLEIGKYVPNIKKLQPVRFFDLIGWIVRFTVYVVSSAFIPLPDAPEDADDVPKH